MTDDMPPPSYFVDGVPLPTKLRDCSGDLFAACKADPLDMTKVYLLAGCLCALARQAADALNANRQMHPLNRAWVIEQCLLYHTTDRAGVEALDDVDLAFAYIAHQKVDG